MECPSCGVANPEDRLECNSCGAGLPHPTLRPPSTIVSAADDPDDVWAEATDTVKVHQPNQLGERYQLIRVLGEGGMGQVYHARDLKLGEEIAIKLLRASLAVTPGEVQRFKREIVTARKITHPNVIRIHDFGEAGPDVFISMELLKGGTLDDKLKSEPMSYERSLEIAIGLAEGLEAAHEQGIVHRDIKPQNILFDEFGTPKLVDFGIARLQSSSTQTQGFTGTPYYMSPEQADGREVTSQSDVYSLGVVLFELFCGRKPFLAESLARLALLHSTEKPPKPRTINPELPAYIADLILKTLEKDPKKRPKSARHLAEDLREARDVITGVRAVPASARSRRGARLALVGFGAALVVAGLGYGGIQLVEGWGEAQNATARPTPIVATSLAAEKPSPSPTTTPRVRPTKVVRRTPRRTPTPKPVVKPGKLLVTVVPFGSFTVAGGPRTLAEGKYKPARVARNGNHKITFACCGGKKTATRTVEVCPGRTTFVKWDHPRGRVTVKPCIKR